ncbi:helix-turn-helix domain-containing protein [Actinocorallia populi]|uniref:helix-turn-helix domain-containing protein n=1 Tax=Actinocorallia populi TaxID=2079200 RepID=UPI000D094613|nr:helix-turn-helix domain-containing protein [Actinocorallia populi]
MKPDDSALAEIFDEPGEIEEIERRAARRLVGLRLGEIRKRLGLTQREVAERMGVSQRRVSAIETGTLDVVRVSTLASYAEALGGALDIAIEIDGRHLKIA